jgi:general secretion pathway protein F
MEAADVAAVIAHLRTAGHLPISADRKSLGATLNIAGLSRWVHAWRHRVRSHELTSATRELATLLNAGIPLDASLRLLAQHIDRPALRLLVDQIHASVQSGQRLSASLDRHARIFDSLYVNLIRAGEASGSLAAALVRLADHRENADTFRASVISSITYPIALAVVALLSLFVLSGFVIPRFIPLFADAGAPLPLLTQIVFAISNFLQNWWWALVGLTCLGLGAAKRWFNNAQHRARFDRWLLSAPMVGELVQATEVVRFASTLGTLLTSGVPLLGALQLARGGQRNHHVASSIERAAATVRSGGRLSRALATDAAFPTLALQLIAIGEESGQLESMLAKAAETFEARTEQRLKRLLTLLEPALILGLGAIVALVIVSILMAMLSLNELVA